MPWFEPLIFDAACLHATCLVISTYYDKAYARDESFLRQQVTYVQYSKAMQKLREKLSFDDESEKLSNSTMMTVMHLANYAMMTGDYTSARQHVGGLCKIMNLRGMTTFVENPLFLVLIARQARSFPSSSAEAYHRAPQT